MFLLPALLGANLRTIEERGQKWLTAAGDFVSIPEVVAR
jgi:hypothetical protein